MKKYFVIGNPIDHSLSPKLHNYWFKENKIKATYDKKKTNEKDLKFIISEIKKKKINGINVTVPFKKAVIPYLDKLSLEAEQTQSVNTIILNNNYLVGHNTDIVGFEKAIKNLNFKIEGKKVFILGAGGVVPSIIFALNKMNVSKITVSNRTEKKAKDLKLLFRNLELLDWGETIDFDVIINATSLGLNKEAFKELEKSEAILSFDDIAENVFTRLNVTLNSDIYINFLALRRIEEHYKEIKFLKDNLGQILKK